MTRARVADVAGHEAAHAVIGALSGHPIRYATLKPGPIEALLGYAAIVHYDNPIPGWPIPTTATAAEDSGAAGYAWDLITGRRRAWHHAVFDRDAAASADAFRAAAGRCVFDLFTRPGVTDAIDLVASRLRSRTTGRITGPEIERILARAGLIPVFDRAEIIAAAVRPDRTKVPA